MEWTVDFIQTRPSGVLLEVLMTSVFGVNMSGPISGRIYNNENISISIVVTGNATVILSLCYFLLYCTLWSFLWCTDDGAFSTTVFYVFLTVWPVNCSHIHPSDCTIPKDHHADHTRVLTSSFEKLSIVVLWPHRWNFSLHY